MTTTCGGLTEAKRIVVNWRCARGALVCPGNWSTQILGAATVHLAAYSPITPFIEFLPRQRCTTRRCAASCKPRGSPFATVRFWFPECSGIGYDLPADIVSRFRIA